MQLSTIHIRHTVPRPFQYRSKTVPKTVPLPFQDRSKTVPRPFQDRSKDRSKTVPKTVPIPFQDRSKTVPIKIEINCSSFNHSYVIITFNTVFLMRAHKKIYVLEICLQAGVWVLVKSVFVGFFKAENVRYGYRVKSNYQI